jgi:hypothetical protein
MEQSGRNQQQPVAMPALDNPRKQAKTVAVWTATGCRSGRMVRVHSLDGMEGGHFPFSA